jgi:antitoxin ChpS
MQTSLRKVGGSIALTIPAAFAKALNMNASGTKVNINMVNGQIIVEPMVKPAPKYTIDQLLAESDFSQPRSEEDKEWLGGESVGKELL